MSGPQEQVQRHTVEQNVDAVTFPPQMVDQPVDILKIIAKLSPAIEERCPRSGPTPQRLELSEPQQLVEQLLEVPLPNPVLLAHGRDDTGMRWWRLHRNGAIYLLSSDIGGLDVQFQCRLFRLVQALTFGVPAGPLWPSLGH